MPFGELDQIADLADDRASLRGPGDRDAAAAPELEQAFIAQHVQGAEHRVLVHAEHGGQVSGLRQPLTWPRLALGNGPADLRGYLIMQGQRASAIEIDFQHGTSHSSSMIGAEQDTTRSSDMGAPALRARGTEVEVLFAQARRRRRHRRLVVVVVSLGLAGALAVGVAAGDGGHGTGVRDGNRGRPAARATSAKLALPAARLAWVDGSGSLIVGDPATGEQHVGPAVDASTSGPLVSASGQLYWADASRDGTPIRDYDLATGKIRYLPRGEAVFTSADRRRLYIARNSSTLLDLPANGSGHAVVRRSPAGWYMPSISPGWAATVAAGGIIVSSSNDQDYVPPTATVGLWNPATGQVRSLGIGIGVFGVYTAPVARYSLVAWAPPSRAVAQDDSLRITNTSTGATVLVRSPLHHGFVAAGAPAFSPGGTQMAVFVRMARLGSSDEMSELAIVDTRTGAVRLVPGADLDTTEDAFWAMWLPGSQRILAGAVGFAYAVDGRTLAATPFSFFPSTDGFSAVPLPARP